MTAYFLTLTLLAENDRTRQVMHAFHAAEKDAASDFAWMTLIILGILLIVFAVLGNLANRLRKKRKSSSPRGLFVELCQAHSLSWSERWLLWRLARSQKLDDPACLFLVPECFEIGRLTAEMRPRIEVLHALHNRLFANPPEDIKPEPGREKSGFLLKERPTAALALPPLPPTLDVQLGEGLGIGD